ncbi:MAG: homoserine dehydrogenase [Actinomycetota bacterium]|nr:homoserine dehydrogenase [Actinomycetota bacterium]
MTSTPINIGLLGCGSVGGALVELIAERADAIEETTGLRLVIGAVAVRNASKSRTSVDESLLTTDARAVVSDPAIDVVVEVIGGIEPARELILEAMKNGKPVVTANKELLANCGSELYGAAAASGIDLLFEAAAAGAIPIIRPLRESLLGEDLRRIMGIVNGTTNYILTKMAEDGAEYADALSDAQRLGYAERDPTADVEGFDAGAKAAIMASLAFGVRVVAGDVYHEGISEVSQADIAFARRLGYEIKLLTIAEVFGSGPDREIGVRVHPAMVPEDHPLASVRDSFNAVFLEGTAAGQLMFYGRGAGGRPTASAVLGDLIDAALNLGQHSHRRVPGGGTSAKIRPIDQLETAYYLNLEVADSPGVLAEVAGVFGRHGVSIRSMEQEGLGVEARLVFITHLATERDLQATVAEFRSLPVVTGVRSLMRVIGE